MDTALVTGWLPALLTMVGVAALLGLVMLPWRKNSWTRGLVVLGGMAIVVASLDLFIIGIWRPFPDTIPWAVLGWGWLGLSGLALAVAHLIASPRRVAAPLAALLAGLTAFAGIGLVQVNRYYGQFPTVGTALGVTRPTLIDLSTLDNAARLLPAPPGGYLSDLWRADSVPDEGKIGRINIPSTASGFRPRPGYVYLPPAYLMTDPRPLLPVLVLLAGQPGTTDAWLVSGRLAQRLDAYAARHRGLAPVVVMADDLGGTWANPQCMGDVETYLGVDVPNWVGTHFQAARRKEMWAIGGLSDGGTCALRMATVRPEVYGRFMDLSGAGEPLGGKRFDGTAGRITVGRDDPARDQVRRTFEECQRAGMDMSWQEMAGAHTWQVWAAALEQSLQWLAAKTNLVRP